MPVKGGLAGKSRLSVPGGGNRQEWAHAVALDTIAAAAACPVGVVLVVTNAATIAASVRHLASDRPVPTGGHCADVRVVADPGCGLNAALTAGANAARQVDPRVAVAALLGDLPALRPQDLQWALAAASQHERSFVPDRLGTGTVLLTAGPGQRLNPQFGPGSATRHGAHATRLDLELPHLRTDVDDAQDLAVAASLGVGPRTKVLLHAAAEMGVTRRAAPQES